MAPCLMTDIISSNCRDLSIHPVLAYVPMKILVKHYINFRDTSLDGFVVMCQVPAHCTRVSMCKVLGAR